MKILESHIQQYVVEYLQLDGWRAFRTELTVQRDRGRVVGERGMPDYLFIRYRQAYERAAINAINKAYIQTDLAYPDAVLSALADLLWVEFKRPGAKKQRHEADQIAWKEAEERRGALVWVVDSIDGFPERYRASGLQRRDIS